MATPAKKKILANVWKDLIGPLNGKLAALCLQRDAYLDKVFHSEALFLDEEVPNANSKEAKAYLSRQLALLERKQVNFALSAETIEVVDDVCRRKNIPRDSFINRVILMLLATDRPKYFNSKFGVPFDYWDRVKEKEYAPENWGPDLFDVGGFRAIAEVISTNPFWAVQIFIMGVIIGFLAWRTDSVIPGIIVHALNNFDANSNLLSN